MTETPVNNPAKIFLYAMLSTVLFAFMNLAVKYAAEQGTHIVQIVLFRNIMALPVILLLISQHIDSRTLLRTRRPIGHMLRGVIGLASMFCFFLSFKILPLGDATALHFAAPIILTALSVPILKEKVGPWRWSAVGIGLVGVIIIANPGGNTMWFGTIVALSAAALSATSSIIVRKIGETENSLTIVFYFTTCGIAVSLILTPFFWSPITSVWAFYALLCVGLLGGIAQYFLTKAYAQAPAAYVSVFSYAAIVFSIGFDIIFWAHIPGLNVWIGSMIVIISGLIILYREVVHKGKVARLSIYSMQPVRPTKADIDDSGQDPDEVAYETIAKKEEKEE